MRAAGSAKGAKKEEKKDKKDEGEKERDDKKRHHRFIDVPRDAQGNPKLPIAVGALTVHSLGTIVHDRAGYHSEKCALRFASYVFMEHYTLPCASALFRPPPPYRLSLNFSSSPFALAGTSGPLGSGALVCTVATPTARR